LYVHLPFCLQRCQYCYYLSYADKSGEQIDRYLDALTTELEIYSRMPALKGRSVDFVYFGGGTPSLLSASRIHQLLTRIKTLFPWNSAREVTFECAPKTVTETKLKELHAAGITRVSLGVQQLDDEVLERNGRIHLVRDVERAYSEIRRFHFRTVNIDLMVGMVGETDTSFRESLERIIDMQPESITIYQLEIPLNTPLYRALRNESDQLRPASWSLKRTRLAAGFSRLEDAAYLVRSGYAAVCDRQHYDFVYQDAQYEGADLLGIGVSSFSYLAGVHFQNLPSLDMYLRSLEAEDLPWGRAYALSDTERYVREFVLQLKLGKVDADYFRRKFGIEIIQRFAEPLQSSADAGWLTFNDDAVVMTREGLLRVDRLIPSFYLPKHRNVRYS
jgi:oxygen-independent coproporphyrinogen-3 oxidase